MLISEAAECSQQMHLIAGNEWWAMGKSAGGWRWMDVDTDWEGHIRLAGRSVHFASSIAGDVGCSCCWICQVALQPKATDPHKTQTPHTHKRAPGTSKQANVPNLHSPIRFPVIIVVFFSSSFVLPTTKRQQQSRNQIHQPNVFPAASAACSLYEFAFGG